RCGKEWWWHFGPSSTFGKEPNPPQCGCGGTFSTEAPARCPSCRSVDFNTDPDELHILYD
ncbi:MAG: hypothetical protein ABR579_06080, partial [Actinomycetota bacterium]